MSTNYLMRTSVLGRILCFFGLHDDDWSIVDSQAWLLVCRRCHRAAEV